METQNGIIGRHGMTVKATLLAILAFSSACAAPTRVLISGGTEDFRAFVREAAGQAASVEIFTDIRSLPLESATNAVFVIAPRYLEGEQTLVPFDAGQLAAFEASTDRGNRFYVENAIAESPREQKFLGLRTYSAQAIPFDHRIVESEAGILQNRAGTFLPASKSMLGKVVTHPTIVASISDALGVNSVYLPATERGPLVAVSADGRRVAAVMRLAPYNPCSMRPYSRWRAFYAALFAPLLGHDKAAVEKAFEKIWPDFLSASGNSKPDIAVKKALAWHENSGILFSADGRKGMREAVILSGAFTWRKELRTDCNLMTGALFAHAGRVYGRTDWVKLGQNLADNILERGNQTEDGFFRWFDRDANGQGKYYVYATDHGRSMLAAVNLHEVTGERRYLQAAQKAADAFLSWQADDGLVTTHFDLRDSVKPAKGHSENPVCYYDNVPALFKVASCTGERKYADAALRCARTMAAKFPNFDLGSGAFYSANSVYGRFLLIAAAAQMSTDDDFSGPINGVLDFYARNQHPAGGISEIKIRLVKHDEAGVGIGDGSDHVADLLYCNNFSLAALSLLLKLPPQKAKGVDMARARDIYCKLRDFICKIQIASPDPRVDGAWMRAYEMDLGEWYGLDRDSGWGPYCIETGWTMGTIPAALIFDGGTHSYWGVNTPHQSGGCNGDTK